MPIAIIGTGRSGTSMVTRMLNLSGLYMGDESALWDKRLNPRMNVTGYWEQRDLHGFMDRFFEHLGGTWENPPHLAAGWENDASLEPFYSEAREIVKRVFGDGEDWAWKLPKASVTIPFWRQVVPGLRFLICVRNPLDFAQSLGAYTSNSRSHLLAMWQYYNFHILCETRPEERLIALYEDFFPCYREALKPLLDFAGLPYPEPDGAVDREIRSFHNPGLKHYTSSLQEVLTDRAVPYVTRELYQQILLSDRSGRDVRLLRYREMLLPLLQLALVGEGTLDGTGAVSKGEHDRLKRRLRRSQWWRSVFGRARAEESFVATVC